MQRVVTTVGFWNKDGAWEDSSEIVNKLFVIRGHNTNYGRY